MSLPASSFFHILNFSTDGSIQVSTDFMCMFPRCLSVSSTAPPSAPISLSWEYETGDGGVSLRWRPPVDMGGRSEVWYGVVCRICPSPTIANPAACSWCGEGVTFSPSQTNLKQTKVTLNNLLTRVTYLIQVVPAEDSNRSLSSACAWEIFRGRVPYWITAECLDWINWACWRFLNTFLWMVGHFLDPQRLQVLCAVLLLCRSYTPTFII